MELGSVNANHIKPDSVISKKMQQILSRSVFLPLITCQSLSSSLREIDSLHEAGFDTIEIALRTQQSFELLKYLSHQNSGLIYGAGTVLSVEQMKLALDYGCKFAVSPGFTADLYAHAERESLAYLPGVFTASELMQASTFGAHCVKFFPSVLGSLSYIDHLQALMAAFSSCTFCPTGGVDSNNAAHFFTLKGVVAVGMSASKLMGKRKKDILPLAIEA